MALFGKNIRTDVIIIALIAAVAGPILALKAPAVLALFGTIGTLAAIVYIINVCCIPMPVCVPMIAMTILSVSSIARLTAVLLFAPAALASLNGILLVLMAGVWTFFALGLASQLTSWTDTRPYGGSRRG